MTMMRAAALWAGPHVQIGGRTLEPRTRANTPRCHDFIIDAIEYRLSTGRIYTLQAPTNLLPGFKACCRAFM